MSDPLSPSPRTPQEGAPIPPSFPQLHIQAITSTLSVFDQTTQSLLKLGSLTIDKFAQDASEELDSFDIPLVDPTNPSAVGYYLGDTTAARHRGREEGEEDRIPSIPPNEAVRYLREISRVVFGTTSTDPLQYEYLDGVGQNQKSCILTITRPNGLSRSYRTKPEFSRKSEAKIAAATSAIQLGATRFIKHGEPLKIVRRRGLVLAKLDSGLKNDESDPKDGTKVANGEGNEAEAEDDSAVAQIEKCCLEWRAGSVVPKWVDIVEQKIPDAHGSALKITLSANIQRAYSVPTSADYPKRSVAMAACARLALEQDVLEFIKHGDGLERPIVVPFEGAETMPPPPPPTVTTLQVFYAALPKPMPDIIGTKPSGEINAIAWLNSTVQAAKGARMSVTYSWYMDTKLGLHGCLLRLSRPGAPSRSYLVEAIFSKRSDAKIAVCLLACSQGVGDYIRAIWAEVDARVTPAMRQRYTETLLPALGALGKSRIGSRPDFVYECDLASFGCTVVIDISPDPETPIKKQWQVPLLYKCKGDAKIAVMCAAADDGMMDFIKHSENPPVGQELRPGAEDASQVAESSELEEGETRVDDSKKKKKKKGKKDVVGGVCKGETKDLEVVKDLKACETESPVGAPLSEMREAALVRGRFDKGGRQQQHSPNRRVRGGGLGRPPFRDEFGGNNPNARGRQSGFGPAFGPGHPRPFGGFSHPPPVPRFHQPHPYSASSRGPGFPGGAYRPRHERLDRNYHFADLGLAHGRHAHAGGAAADTAPPPAPPHVAPAYNVYLEREQDYDYARDRQDPYLQPPFSGAGPPHPRPHPGAVRPPVQPRAYGYGYPDAAPGGRRQLPPPPQVPHMYRQSLAADYRYMHEEDVGRPAHGVSRAYGQEHYAPDYDCIPDRGAAVREPPPPTSPHSHTLHRSTNTPLLHQGLTRQSHAPPTYSHTSPSHSSAAAAHPPLQHPHSHRSGYGAQPPYVEHRTPEKLRHARATYQRPPAQPAPDVPEDEVVRRRIVYERELDIEKSRAVALASRPPRVHKSDPQAHAKLEEKLDNVISRLEGEVNANAALPLEGDAPDGGGEPVTAAQLPSPVSGRKPSMSNGSGSPSPGQPPKVPSKRGRSLDRENSGSPSSKRMRDRSRSMSMSMSMSISTSTPRHSERGGYSRSAQSTPSSASGMSISSADDGRERPGFPPPTSAENSEERKDLKRAREGSPGPVTEGSKGSEHKEESHVAALFDYCDQEGLPRPELCHEEVASDDKTDRPFKVWVVMGKERLELPTSFPTLVLGQERVAKSVLGRLRLQTKKQKT